jgi:hypothetical protein
LLLTLEYQLRVAIRPQSLHNQQPSQQRRQTHNDERHRKRLAVVPRDEPHKVFFWDDDENRPVTPDSRVQRRGRADVSSVVNVEGTVAVPFNPKMVEGACQHWITEVVQLNGLQFFANPFEQACQVWIRHQAPCLVDNHGPTAASDL